MKRNKDLEDKLNILLEENDKLVRLNTFPE